MDRNQAIGLVLISAMMLVYFTWIADEPITPESLPTTTELVVSQEETSINSNDVTITEVPDSVTTALNSEKFGMFASAAAGTAELTTLENENITVAFSSKGASIANVVLKDFKTYDFSPLVLLDEKSSQTSLLIKHAGREINLSDLYYSLSQEDLNDTTYLTYTADIASGQSIKQVYSFPKSGYQIGYRVQLIGLNGLVDSDQLSFLWNNKLKRLESDISTSRKKASINYYLSEGDFEDLGDNSEAYDEEEVNTSLNWAVMKQKFFTSGIVAEKVFTKGKFTLDVNEADTTVIKSVSMALSIPVDHLTGEGGQFKYYFGPNKFDIYEKVAPGFSDNLDLGWTPVNFVNEYVIIKLFHFFEKYIDNYGIIILILVLVIKLVLSPLSYKSYVSMAKTKVLKPELDKLKEKYGDDAQKIQSEQMTLYRQVGVNPISGCIPMVLQMPILFALFYFFPNSIELRQESFLWAHDLSTYDSVLDLPFTIPFYGNHVSLFTLLMTASTILYTWSNNQVSSVQGPMKSISYMMPIMFLFFLNSFSAGLTFYYFVANIVTFGQQAIIRKFVDEDKIKAILDDNRKNNVNKKKSKFQQRLDDAMKSSQETQKKKKKK
jgi:YidC/Oxa1 family membrane protein insertase